jgi:outer membrane protein OmpA-like peptidoglycan-associated protein
MNKHILMMKSTLISVTFLLMTIVVSCTYTQKIKDGTMAYERKQYAVAVQMLPAEIKKSENIEEQSKLAMMLADSYRILNKPKGAKEWFLKSYELSGNPDALKNYAFALKELEEYDAAAKAFEDLIFQTGDAFLWRKEVAACKQAQGWIDVAKERSEIILKPADFNSKAMDFAPILYKNGQVVFTSDRMLDADAATYQWTGRSYSNLFIVGDNCDAELFDKVFNSDYNDGTITFNKDYTEAYFSRCGEPNNDGQTDYCKLMYSKFEEGEWSKPVPMTEIMIENTNYAQPALSADGNTLYFATDITDGYGGFDIYFTRKLFDGTWDLPENLGSQINTEGNELFPYIDADTLFFASDFHVGMGGLDIFKTFQSRSGRWSPLQNLKAPINSGADDFGYIIDYQTERLDTVLQVGYFVTNRNGSDDIYEFSKIKLTPEAIVPTLEEEVLDTKAIVDNTEIKYILEINTIETVYNTPDEPSSGILGKENLPNTSIVINDGQEKESIETNDEGFYEMEIYLGKVYDIYGSKGGYLNNSTSFSSIEIVEDPEKSIRRFKVTLELKKEIVGKEFTLDNIYYDLDKYEIRKDAEPTLNKLATILKENPTIKIQLNSHTDCQGNDTYNNWLSQKRAEEAVNYLISLGINVDRLQAKGYGESRPSIACVCSDCTKAQHQQNRRTTFIILE